MARNDDRVYDPHTRRRYKKGYEPAALLRPISATCLRCGKNTLVIYPTGSVCSNCSPADAGVRESLATDRERVRRGYIPLAEE